MPPFGRLAICIKGGLRNDGPRELPGAPNAFGAELIGGSSTPIDHRAGDRVRIVGVGEDGRTPRDFGHGADGGCHDRAGAGHRLEYRQSEGFVEGRIDEEVGRPVEVDGLLVGYAADKDDILTDAQLVDQFA